MGGFEPTMAGPKPAALPLGYIPKFVKLYYRINAVNNKTEFFIVKENLRTIKFLVFLILC
jgi:hypothetical protein